MRPEKNFNVGLSNAILEPKHYRAMGEALWLYTYLLDRQGKGRDKNGLGQVAGSMPIRDSDIASTLGSSEKTISRWRKRLRSHSYITARRTPYGYTYAITKAKKWQDKPVERSDKSVSSLTARDRTRTAERSDTNGRNKEEMSVDTERERQETLPVLDSEMEGRIWDIYLKEVKPESTSTYSFTPSRKKMLTMRYREMISAGNTPHEARTHLVEAIFALAADDYHMGRKKKYEGRFQNDFKDIFDTQEVFEKWCTIYQANEEAGRA
jgi:hypothetical protein